MDSSGAAAPARFIASLFTVTICCSSCPFDPAQDMLRGEKSSPPRRASLVLRGRRLRLIGDNRDGVFGARGAGRQFHDPDIAKMDLSAFGFEADVALLD